MDTPGEALCSRWDQVGKVTEALWSMQQLNYIMNDEQKFPEGLKGYKRKGRIQMETTAQLRTGSAEWLGICRL